LVTFVSGDLFIRNLQASIVKELRSDGAASLSGTAGIALVLGTILLLAETIRAKREVHPKEKGTREGTQEHARIIGAVLAWTVVFSSPL